MLVPVIKTFLGKKGYSVLVLGLTTAGHVLKKNGIEYLGFKDLVDSGDKEALSYGVDLAKNMPPNEKISLEETIAYLGLSFYELLEKYGAEEASRIYSLKGRQSFLPVKTISRIFSTYKPDVLVSTNSPRSERASFIAAKEFGVPSVCIVGLFAMHEIQWIGEKDFCTSVCVISDSVKRMMVDYGRRDEDVYVTGNPAFDRLARTSLEEESCVFRANLNVVDKKIILWASQPEPAVHPFTGVEGNPVLPRIIEKKLIEIVQDRDDLLLIVRHHPGENVECNYDYKNVYFSSSDDLAVTLKASDLVITMTSTVGVEGVLLNKPLITVDTSIFQADAPYSDMKLSIGIRDLSELEVSINRALTGEFQSEKLPEVGKAANNVSDVILDALKPL